MKTYNITTRVSSQARREIMNIINTHEKYRHSFLFSPAANAAGRRRKETYFALAHPDVSFKKADSLISVTMSYKESCKNVYYKLIVSIKNGDEERFGNISTIKKLLK